MAMDFSLPLSAKGVKVVRMTVLKLEGYIYGEKLSTLERIQARDKKIGELK